MNELITAVTALALTEYEQASQKHGRQHNSPHEAYSVILEEFEEAIAESEKLKSALHHFWCLTKSNEPTDDVARKIREAALHMAAESLQVAAMAHKASFGYNYHGEGTDGK